MKELERKLKSSSSTSSLERKQASPKGKKFPTSSHAAIYEKPPFDPKIWEGNKSPRSPKRGVFLPTLRTIPPKTSPPPREGQSIVNEMKEQLDPQRMSSLSREERSQARLQ